MSITIIRNINVIQMWFGVICLNRFWKWWSHSEKEFLNEKWVFPLYQGLNQWCWLFVLYMMCLKKFKSFVDILSPGQKHKRSTLTSFFWHVLTTVSLLDLGLQLMQSYNCIGLVPNHAGFSQTWYSGTCTASSKMGWGGFKTVHLSSSLLWHLDRKTSK